MASYGNSKNQAFKEWIATLTPEERKYNLNNAFKLLKVSGKEECFRSCLHQLVRRPQVLINQLTPAVIEQYQRNSTGPSSSTEPEDVGDQLDDRSEEDIRDSETIRSDVETQIINANVHGAHSPTEIAFRDKVTKKSLLSDKLSEQSGVNNSIDVVVRAINVDAGDKSRYTVETQYQPTPGTSNNVGVHKTCSSQSHEAVKKIATNGEFGLLQVENEDKNRDKCGETAQDQTPANEGSSISHPSSSSISSLVQLGSGDGGTKNNKATVIEPSQLALSSEIDEKTSVTNLKSNLKPISEDIENQTYIDNNRASLTLNDRENMTGQTGKNEFSVGSSESKDLFNSACLSKVCLPVNDKISRTKENCTNIVSIKYSQEDSKQVHSWWTVYRNQYSDEKLSCYYIHPINDFNGEEQFSCGEQLDDTNHESPVTDNNHYDDPVPFPTPATSKHSGIPYEHHEMPHNAKLASPTVKWLPPLPSGPPPTTPPLPPLPPCALPPLPTYPQPTLPPPPSTPPLLTSSASASSCASPLTSTPAKPSTSLPASPLAPLLALPSASLTASPPVSPSASVESLSASPSMSLHATSSMSLTASPPVSPSASVETLSVSPSTPSDLPPSAPPKLPLGHGLKPDSFNACSSDQTISPTGQNIKKMNELNASGKMNLLKNVHLQGHTTQNPISCEIPLARNDNYVKKPTNNYIRSKRYHRHKRWTKHRRMKNPKNLCKISLSNIKMDNSSRIKQSNDMLSIKALIKTNGNPNKNNYVGIEMNISMHSKNNEFVNEDQLKNKLSPEIIDHRNYSSDHKNKNVLYIKELNDSKDTKLDINLCSMNNMNALTKNKLTNIKTEIEVPIYDDDQSDKIGPNNFIINHIKTEHFPSLQHTMFDEKNKQIPKMDELGLINLSQMSKENKKSLLVIEKSNHTIENDSLCISSPSEINTDCNINRAIHQKITNSVVSVDEKHTVANREKLSNKTKSIDKSPNLKSPTLNHTKIAKKANASQNLPELPYSHELNPQNTTTLNNSPGTPANNNDLALDAKKSQNTTTCVNSNSIGNQDNQNNKLCVENNDRALGEKTPESKSCKHDTLNHVYKGNKKQLLFDSSELLHHINDSSLKKLTPSYEDKRVLFDDLQISSDDESAHESNVLFQDIPKATSNVNGSLLKTAFKNKCHSIETTNMQGFKASMNSLASQNKVIQDCKTLHKNADKKKNELVKKSSVLEKKNKEEKIDLTLEKNNKRKLKATCTPIENSPSITYNVDRCKKALPLGSTNDTDKQRDCLNDLSNYQSTKEQVCSETTSSFNNVVDKINKDDPSPYKPSSIRKRLTSGMCDIIPVKPKPVPNTTSSVIISTKTPIESISKIKNPAFPVSSLNKESNKVINSVLDPIIDGMSKSGLPKFSQSLTKSPIMSRRFSAAQDFGRPVNTTNRIASTQFNCNILKPISRTFERPSPPEQTASIKYNREIMMKSTGLPDKDKLICGKNNSKKDNFMADSNFKEGNKRNDLSSHQQFKKGSAYEQKPSCKSKDLYSKTLSTKITSSSSMPIISLQESVPDVAHFHAKPNNSLDKKLKCSQERPKIKVSIPIGVIKNIATHNKSSVTTEESQPIFQLCSTLQKNISDAEELFVNTNMKSNNADAVEKADNLISSDLCLKKRKKSNNHEVIVKKAKLDEINAKGNHTSQSLNPHLNLVKEFIKSTLNDNDIENMKVEQLQLSPAPKVPNPQVLEPTLFKDNKNCSKVDLQKNNLQSNKHTEKHGTNGSLNLKISLKRKNIENLIGPIILKKQLRQHDQTNGLMQDNSNIIVSPPSEESTSISENDHQSSINVKKHEDTHDIVNIKSRLKESTENTDAIVKESISQPTSNKSTTGIVLSETNLPYNLELVKSDMETGTSEPDENTENSVTYSIKTEVSSSEEELKTDALQVNMSASVGLIENENSNRKSTIKVKDPNILLSVNPEIPELPPGTIGQRRISLVNPENLMEVDSDSTKQKNTRQTWYMAPKTPSAENQVNQSDICGTNDLSYYKTHIRLLEIDSIKRKQFVDYFNSGINVGVKDLGKLKDIIDCLQLDYKLRDDVIGRVKKVLSSELKDEEIKRVGKDFDSKVNERCKSFNQVLRDLLTNFNDQYTKVTVYVAIFLRLSVKVKSVGNDNHELINYLLSLIKKWLETEESKEAFESKDPDFESAYKLMLEIFQKELPLYLSSDTSKKMDNSESANGNKEKSTNLISTPPTCPLISSDVVNRKMDNVQFSNNLISTSQENNRSSRRNSTAVSNIQDSPNNQITFSSTPMLDGNQRHFTNNSVAPPTVLPSIPINNTNIHSQVPQNMIHSLQPSSLPPLQSSSQLLQQGANNSTDIFISNPSNVDGTNTLVQSSSAHVARNDMYYANQYPMLSAHSLTTSQANTGVLHPSISHRSVSQNNYTLINQHNINIQCQSYPLTQSRVNESLHSSIPNVTQPLSRDSMVSHVPSSVNHRAPHVTREPQSNVYSQNQVHNPLTTVQSTFANDGCTVPHRTLHQSTTLSHNPRVRRVNSYNPGSSHTYMDRNAVNQQGQFANQPRVARSHSHDSYPGSQSNVTQHTRQSFENRSNISRRDGQSLNQVQPFQSSSQQAVESRQPTGNDIPDLGFTQEELYALAEIVSNSGVAPNNPLPSQTNLAYQPTFSVTTNQQSHTMHSNNMTMNPSIQVQGPVNPNNPTFLQSGSLTVYNNAIQLAGHPVSSSQNIFSAMDLLLNIEFFQGVLTSKSKQRRHCSINNIKYLCTDISKFLSIFTDQIKRYGLHNGFQTTLIGPFMTSDQRQLTADEIKTISSLPIKRYIQLKGLASRPCPEQQPTIFIDLVDES